MFAGLLHEVVATPDAGLLRGVRLLATTEATDHAVGARHLVVTFAVFMTDVAWERLATAREPGWGESSFDYVL